jgi:hypothetical protein
MLLWAQPGVSRVKYQGNSQEDKGISMLRSNEPEPLCGSGSFDLNIVALFH